jgi:hypothetical protein
MSPLRQPPLTSQNAWYTSFMDAHESITQPPAASRKTRPTHIPNGLAVVDNAGHWSATWRWVERSRAWILGAFIGAWDAILLLVYYQAITKGRPWMMLLFPLIHASLGLWLTYWFAAYLLNRTCVTLVGGLIVVRHRPLPWPGNRILPAENLKYVFIVHLQAQENGPGWSRMRHWYRLVATMKQSDGSTKEVRVATLTNARWAAYVRRELERRARIASTQTSPVTTD